MRRLMVLTRETREFQVIRQKSKWALGLCDVCNAEVRWLSTKEVVALTRLSEREVFRMAEAGEFHNVESADRFMQFCFASVMRCG